MAICECLPHSSLQVDSKDKFAAWPANWRPPGAGADWNSFKWPECTEFTPVTWTLAMALPWWQHFDKHCPNNIIVVVITTTTTTTIIIIISLFLHGLVKQRGDLVGLGLVVKSYPVHVKTTPGSATHVSLSLRRPGSVHVCAAKTKNTRTSRQSV